MKDKQNEQMIRDVYRNTHTPDTVKNRIEDTLHSLNNKGQTDSSPSFHVIHKKALPLKKIAAIAAAALLCIGGTGFAANKIYQMHLEKEHKHQANLHISSKEALPDKVKEIEMRVNYIPEGFQQASYRQEEHYYVNPENSEVGYYIDEPMLIDTKDPLSVSFIKDSENLSVKGHEALYLCETHSEDQTWKKEKLYILYDDLDRILSVTAWGHADKKELIKIAENIELLPTGNKISSEGLPRFSELVDSMNQTEDKDTDVPPEDEYYFTEANVSDMTVHQIGDKFDVPSSLDDGSDTRIQLEASVTDVQVADDLSLLTEDEEIHEDWRKLIGADGKLTSDTLKYIKLGDGINTLSETVRTEQVPVKLVYATVEYTNNTSDTLYDAWYMASLIPVVQDGDVFRILDRTDDTCDYVENEHIGVGGEMCYSDVFGGHLNKNYIPKIEPGESATVHLAWVVNEDELDKLYLNFQGDNIFSEQGLEIGYVDLNL